MPSPKSTPQGSGVGDAVGIVGQAGEKASPAAHRDADGERRHELQAGRTADAGRKLEDLHRDDAAGDRASNRMADLPEAGNRQVEAAESKCTGDRAKAERDEITRIAEWRAHPRRRFQIAARRNEAGHQPGANPSQDIEDKMNDHSLAPGTSASVHLRGKTLCAASVSRASHLRNARSSVHSNQISQAGVEVSRWAAKN